MAANALGALRAALQKDRELLRDQMAKGLPRKAYWTAHGKYLQINAVLERIAAMIKVENGGDDGGSTTD